MTAYFIREKIVENSKMSAGGSWKGLTVTKIPILNIDTKSTSGPRVIIIALSPPEISKRFLNLVYYYLNWAVSKLKQGNL